MKIEQYIGPIKTELVAVIAAALIFAFLQRNSPTLRAWLSPTPTN